MYNIIYFYIFSFDFNLVCSFVIFIIIILFKYFNQTLIQF